MAAPEAIAYRLKKAADTMWDALATALEMRRCAITMGGVSYVADVLDGDPDPVADLSSTQLGQGLNALNAVDQQLAADSEAGKKALLALFFTPDEAVNRSRTATRKFLTALAHLKAYRTELTLLANGTALIDFLTAELGAEDAALIVDAFDHIAEIETVIASSSRDLALTRVAN